MKADRQPWMAFARCLRGVLLFLIFWWLLGLWLLRRIRGGRGSRGDDEGVTIEGRGPPGCVPVPPDVYRRPDPMLYSQGYLMSQGLAVTWDNPDIHLERGGVPVPSSALLVDTEYDVVARIWNGSNSAPAVHLPVAFAFLAFGIGTVRVPIGQTHVDLPVNGAPGHPAIAHMTWRTPAAPGHYCLQVEALWADDANPANNLGQENTDVRPLNSPHAAFTFPLRNDTLWPQTLRLEADAYRIPARPRCEPGQVAETGAMTDEEKAAHRRDALARHDRRGHPVPEGWRVAPEPRALDLRPGEQREVTVDITAPEGFAGRQAINVNAFDGERLVGGVTLYVDGSGE